MLFLVDRNSILTISNVGCSVWCGFAMENALQQIHRFPFLAINKDSVLFTTSKIPPVYHFELCIVFGGTEKFEYTRSFAQAKSWCVAPVPVKQTMRSQRVSDEL